MTTSNGESNLNNNSFNLVDRPWIPVVDSSGKTTTVGLRELFERAEELVDLATGTLETIAVFRLLFCIAQRALGDLEDEDAWLEARERLTEKVVYYLEKWKSRFDLFDKEYPFLQIAQLEPRKADSTKKKKTDISGVGIIEGNAKTDKLDFGLATGDSTSTVFDQNAVEDGRVHTPEWLAIKLLTFQSFSPGGLIGSSNWDHITGNKNNRSFHAPCTQGSMLLTILKGKILAQTLCWNLLMKEQIGSSLENNDSNKPVWECDILGNQQERENIKNSFLGRLVPLSRLVKLIDYQNMVLSGGFIYDPLPQYRELMGTTYFDTKKKIKYLSTDPERSPWRDLYALLNLDQGTGGARALKNLPLIYDDESEEYFSIWVGGIVADQAKIIDTANWTVQVRTEFCRQGEELELYQEGVKRADDSERRLRNAIKEYHCILKIESESPNKENMKTSRITQAKRFFWSGLERKQDKLQECAIDDDLRDWDKILQDELETVYARVCPRLSPRELLAYAKGKKRLYSRIQKGTQTDKPRSDREKEYVSQSEISFENSKKNPVQKSENVRVTNENPSNQTSEVKQKTLFDFIE